MTEVNKPVAPKVATVPTPPKPAKHQEAADKGTKVKNISTNTMYILSGKLDPDEVGYASDAEVSNFVGILLEKV